MAEQRIYFANHQSHLDWVLIWAALPHELRVRTRPIAARDYWANTPLKRWLTTEVFHAVYVERSRSANPEQDPLEPLVAALEQGDSLVIFPEGTRSAQDEPQPFKSGLYHLAAQFPQVRLVPCLDRQRAARHAQGRGGAGAGAVHGDLRRAAAARAR
jgi:1-acyl-sn-glycerol-3-phosphate acyltransferase